MKIATFLFYSFLTSQLFAAALPNPWDLWSRGQMKATETVARSMLKAKPNEARHLLTLASFVQGKFEATIKHQAHITPSYFRYNETIVPVVNALLHLNQFQKAYQFALEKNLDQSGLLESLRQMSMNSPKFELSSTSRINFKKSDDLNDFLPAFDIEISGRKLTAHLDTGGPFLVMSTHLAKDMGLTLFSYGKGHCNNREADVWFTQTEILLGHLRARNLPTMVSDCIDNTDMKDRVIFGTNLLQRFLTTIDYPNSMLVLTPFGQRLQHLNRRQHHHPAIKVPFYIWGDHFMFAKGSIGIVSNLLFFVDTGLVTFHEDGRQAAFLTSTQNLESWGYNKDELDRHKVVDIVGSLNLGPLTQKGPPVKHQKEITFGHLGGIGIAGLIGHAFFKNYKWTIDFRSMTYEFGLPAHNP